MTTIARGDIEVNLNDAEVIAGLRAVDSQFDRTMRKIEHSRAEATIDAKLRPLEQKMDKAQAILRKWKAERANAAVDADTKPFDEKIARVETYIKRLDHRKATVEVEVHGDREALRALKSQQDELDKLGRAAEQAARRQQQAHRQNTVGIRQEAADVARLQQQYARLTDRLERITAKRPIGRENRAKVELDATSTILQMEALKAKLNAMGGHPPVHIKADIDKSAAQRVTGFLANIGNKAAKLSDLTVRIGPFTSSIKGLITALGFLGPTITDLLGAAGALVGTLGAGIAGAAVIGTGALVGLAGAGLGLVFSLRNTKQEVTNARTAINAYQKAVEQYGAKSDQAKKKQDQMNHTLKSISPLARESALGIERFFRTWDKGTKATQGNLGRIAKAGFQALDAITPMWAHRTNEMSRVLADNLSKGFKFVGSGPGRGMLNSIFGDFNAQLPVLLHGLGAFGQGLLRIAVEGAHNLGILTHGIDNLGQKFLAFTQRDTFGATIHSWVMQARDLMRFFGALTRVAVHFFGAGSKAGQGMVENMTNALNRWDRFLTSTAGSGRVAQGFQRAADGATALWHAIAPLVGSFIEWANNLSPFVTGVIQGVSFVSRLTAKLTELLGLGGPLATLGATLGAMWAVGKIGTFVSILSRIPSILREVKAAGTFAGMLGALGNMKFGALGATGIEAAGASAAAEIQAAIVAGGGEAAAEIRAAMITGGAAAAAEEGVAGAAGGAAAGAAGAAAAAGGAAAAAGEATVAAEAVGGLTIATGGAILVIAGLGIGLGILASKLGHGKTEVEKLNEALKNNSEITASDQAVISGEASAQDKAARAHRDAAQHLRTLRKELAQAKPGTLEYRDLQLRVWDATQKRNQSIKDGINDARDQRRAASQSIDDIRKQIDLTKQQTAARIAASNKKLLPYGRGQSTPLQITQAEAAANRIAAEGAAVQAALEARVTAALNARAAAALNVARAQRGMLALSGRAAQQAGLLARQNPAVAQNIATKFTSPKNVGEVSQAARRAIGQGVSVKTVLKIVADSKDADAALARLRTIELRRKLLKLGITGHEGVLSKLSEIDRKAIRQKIARIIQHGGEPTLAMITRIINRQIRDKSFTVRANTAAALGQIQAVQNLMASLHDKTVVLRVLQASAKIPAGKLATGRGPRGTERALIGEGNAPEHYVDPERGMSFRTAGPMIMDLSPSAFIIPTETAYRARGKELLREAASDLGMNMYAGSRKPKKKSAKHAFHKLPISRGGSIKTDYFVTRQQETQNAYNRNATTYNSAHKRMGTTQEALDRAVAADHKHHTAASAKSVDNARKHHRAAVKEFNQAKKLDPTLDAARKKAQSEYTTYAKDQNKIEQYTSDMNAAATKYNATGDSAFLDAWTAAKSKRQPIYTELVSMITEAKKHAGGKWQSELNKMLSGVQADDASAAEDAAPTGPDASLSLDDFIRSLGLGDNLTALNTALSVAGLSADVSDDQAAANALVSFYTDLYGRATGTGNQGLIGLAADALHGARDTLTGLMAPTQDDQAVADQLRQQLYASQRQTAASEAYIQTALGPGDIGSGTAGSAAAAARGPIINIHTLHPADPATLRAIGDAATAGMGYQPSVSSSVLRTGM